MVFAAVLLAYRGSVFSLGNVWWEIQSKAWLQVIGVINSDGTPSSTSYTALEWKLIAKYRLYSAKSSRGPN